MSRLVESGTSTLRIQRQESVVMENLRQLEEREALEKWERIVRYCKEVLTIHSQDLKLLILLLPYHCLVMPLCMYAAEKSFRIRRVDRRQTIATETEEAGS